MFLVFPLVLVSCIHIILSSESNGAGRPVGIGETNSSSTMALRVNGNNIEYGIPGNYRTVILRGVNVGDLYHFSKFKIPPPNYNYIANTINANCIRIAVHPNLWQNEKSAVLAFLKENTQKALNSGLFVIIDYHTIGFPDGNAQSLNDKVIAYVATFKTALDFWQVISKEITDGRVLYELWNEPTSGNYVSSYAARWTALKSYWEQLIKVIRNNGSQNICIVGGDDWTHELRGIKNSLIQDTNTAYAWHIYAGHDKNNPTEWEKRLDTLYKERPVVVTEWGYSDNPLEEEYDFDGVFAEKFVPDFLDAKNLHSMAWGYDPFYKPSMLVGGDYRNFSAFGKTVIQYLQSNEQEWP